MTSDFSPHVKVGIIGGGVAALVASVVFRSEGMGAGDVAVFSPHADPLLSIEKYGTAIGQQELRSETEGHFFPTDFPGLALVDSVRLRSARPVVRAAFNAYHPTFADWLAHGRQVAASLPTTHVAAVVGDVVYDAREQVFCVYDTASRLVGKCEHVVLALGRPGLRVPGWAKSAHVAPFVTHAYEPKQYAGESVVVVGSGMAAAHEQVSALLAGCRVTAVARSPRVRQDLNLPRCEFTTQALRRYWALPPAERHAFLNTVRTPSYPRKVVWEKLFRNAEREGRLVYVRGEVAEIEVGSWGARVRIKGRGVVPAQRIVLATGFEVDARKHALVDTLCTRYGFAVEQGRIIADNNCTVPGIGTPQHMLAVAGGLAEWAIPFADTVAGMKYVARRLVATFGLPRSLGARINTTLQLCRGAL